jgi:hypothetical protein
MVTARMPAPQTSTPAPSPPRRPARTNRTPTPAAAAATRRIAGPPSVRLTPSAVSAVSQALPSEVARDVRSAGPGKPLPERVRATLEQSFDADLSHVRVHTNPQVAASMEARALALGTHIYLGNGESPENVALMAHEVAHVVQQQGAARVQQYTTTGADPFEREAEQASSSVQRGERAEVRGRTGGPQAQRQGLLARGVAWVRGGVETVVEGSIEWLREQVWSLLETHAPDLVPILRQGVVEWLKERISAGIQSMMETMARPVRTIGDLVAGLRRHFTNLIGWLRVAGGQIAAGDCSSIAAAADKIHQAFDALASPVVDRVKHYVNAVKGFFQSVWERFGAPVWQLLQRIGGAIWEKIQQVGRWIWEKTAPIRNLAARAWRWFKNWLGIGEGEEGQNGVLQWFQRKASAAWEWVSARLAPYKRQILIAVGVLALLSPAGPFIAMAAVSASIMRGLVWLRQNMRAQGGVLRGRTVLRGVILPAILNAIGRVSEFVSTFAARITGGLNRLIEILGSMAETVASIPILSFASGLINFVTRAFNGLLGWARESVQAMAGMVQSRLQLLGSFARRLVDFLERVAMAARNVLRLGHALGGRIWNAIPACIRDPFIDFFIPLILRQIPFFRELGANEEAWQQTRAQIMALIRQIFRDFDIFGALRTAFGIVVRGLRIPVDLAVQVIERGAQAFDLVVAAPLRFIENALKAILRGLGLFLRNFLSHLWFGVQGWLLNAVEQSGTGVQPPQSWDLQGLFGFVLDILGISFNHVLDLLARRVDRRIVERIRTLGRAAVSFFTGVWEWMQIAINEGPAGLWRHVVDRLSNLGQIVLEAAVRWVMTRIIAIVGARLSALAASGGWSGVLEAIFAVYQAINTAIEYARQILQTMLTVFDTIVAVARGVIDPAAQGVERGLRMIMPIVIGFLANYAGLGGIGQRIREVILAVRERVDSAILWLIDRALAGGRWILDRLRAGVAAVVQWWQMRRGFRTDDGQSHQLFFRGQGRTARVVVASDEISLDTLLAPGGEFASQIAASRDQAKITALGAARSEHQRVKSAQNTLQTNSSDPAATQQIRTAFDSLAQQLAILGVGVLRYANLPKTRIDHVENAGKAGTVKASPLTRKLSGGSRPDPNIVGWQHVLQIDHANWERTHLISAEFDGPGRYWNLVPARRTDNAWFRDNPEERIKRMLPQNYVLHYEVQILSYYTNLINPATNQPIDGFPQQARLKLTTMKKENNQWMPDVDLTPFPSKSFVAPSVTPTQGVDLKTAGRDALIALGIPRGVAGNVDTVRRQLGGSFGSQQVFETEMQTFYQNIQNPAYRRDFRQDLSPLFTALISSGRAFF